MTYSINGIDKNDYQNISLEYDFDKNGKIDIEDYNLASKSEDILEQYSQSTLDKVFKNIISNKDNDDDSSNIETNKENTEELQNKLKDLSNLTDQKIYNQNLSASNLSDKSLAELRQMQEEINNNLEKLEKKLDDLSREKIQLEHEQKSAKNNFDDAEDDYNKTAEYLTNENNELIELSANYTDISEIITGLNKNIETQKKNSENVYKNNVNNAKDKAATDYNQDTDGDYQTFVMNKVANVSKNGMGNLASLNSSAENYSSQADTILSNINAQSTVVNNYVSDLDSAKIQYESASTELGNANDEVIENAEDIATTNDDISATEADADAIDNEIASRVDGANLTGTEVLAQISDAEKQLAIDNNIDLTTCMIAKGADGAFHIYDSNGTSLARTYGSNGGYDIIPTGSGYMNNLTTTEEDENARAVYKFSCVNDDLTEGTACWDACCYCTCSPLSFDVEGDGFKTSNSTIMYDIDGDGKKDSVNNSSEWVLAFDKDGDGKVGTNGSELFGNNTDLDNDGKADGYADGFEALKSLATQEGLISDNDKMLDANDLKTLQDKYGLTMMKGYDGESKDFASLGITQINLANTTDTTLTKNFDGKNNDIMRQEGATFVVNGQTREYADIWNAKQNMVSENSINKVKEQPIKYSVYDTDVTLNQNAKKDAKETTKQSYEKVATNIGQINYEFIVNKIKNNLVLSK